MTGGEFLHRLPGIWRALIARAALDAQRIEPALLASALAGVAT